MSGRAHGFLEERFGKENSLSVEEIDGLTLRYFGSRLDRAGSLFWNLRSAPKAVRKNIKVYGKVAEDGFRPELVISDFESFAALYALRHRLPVVSIENIQERIGKIIASLMGACGNFRRVHERRFHFSTSWSIPKAQER